MGVREGVKGEGRQERGGRVGQNLEVRVCGARLRLGACGGCAGDAGHGQCPRGQRADGARLGSESLCAPDGKGLAFLAEGREEQCTRPAMDKRARATSKAWPDATFPTARVNGSWMHPFTVLRSGGCPEATPAFPDCP